MAERRKGCQWLYLRVTVGLLNALFVLGVALVALLVTATASLKALNDNGEAHVAALGKAAAYRAAVFFQRPELQARALADYGVTEALTFPSKHSTASMTETQRLASDIPRGGTELDRLSTLEVSSTMAFDMQLFGTTIWLGDGSRVIEFPIPQVKNALYVEKWWRDNVTDVLSHRETIMYDTKTRLRINSSDPRHGIFMPSRENVTLTDASKKATFDALSFLVNIGRKQPVKWSTPRFFHEVVPYRYVLCGAALYNATDLLGFAISGVTLGSIAAVLDGVRTSPNAMALVLDDEGYILGSSGGHHTFNMTPYSGGPVGEGCTTTDVTRNTIPSDKRLISCMHHFSNFEVPIVRQIALGHDDHDHEEEAHLFKASAGGESYFVQVQGVHDIALHAIVVVIVPEKEILGNVQQTIVVASLITAACVVVAAVACFGLVWWLLWPLRGIAVRMGKAARLEEDPDPVAISPLAEIGDLQRAFVEMRDELDRIRSYVPQSLLRANDSTDAEEDEEQLKHEESGMPTTNMSSSRRSFIGSVTPRSKYEQVKDNLSVHSLQDSESQIHSNMSGGSTSSRVTAHRKGHREMLTSKLTDSLRRDVVSVVCLNVCGFHRFVDGGSVQRNAVTSLVDAVLRVAHSERGVVESFHGDRFLVSFNAVKPAANHGTRATVMAMQVAEAAEGLGLAVTAGVATGTAQVGNMGTKGMMRFSIVGPVVAQASALERMCKLYANSHVTSTNDLPVPLGNPARCLVPQRLFQDLSTAAVTRTVDYVHLPQAKNPCLIAEVDHLLRAGADDEWMYQLNHPDRVHPIATANAAWMASVSGDLANAHVLCAALDEHVERSPNDVLCRRAADCPRLRAIVSSRPEPRLLGEFYEKTLQHPTS